MGEPETPGRSTVRLTPWTFLFPGRLLRETGAADNPFLLRASRRRRRWRSKAARRSMEALLLILTFMVAMSFIGPWNVESFVAGTLGIPPFFYYISFPAWFLLMVRYQLGHYDRAVTLKLLNRENLEELSLTPMGREHYFLHQFCRGARHHWLLPGAALIVGVAVALDSPGGGVSRLDGLYWAAPVGIMVVVAFAVLLAALQYIVEWRAFTGRRSRMGGLAGSLVMTLILLLCGFLPFYATAFALVQLVDLIALPHPHEFILLYLFAFHTLLTAFLMVCFLAQMTHLGLWERLLRRMNQGGKRPPLPLRADSLLSASLNPFRRLRLPPAPEPGPPPRRRLLFLLLCSLAPVMGLFLVFPSVSPVWLLVREMVGIPAPREELQLLGERSSIMPFALFLLAGGGLSLRRLAGAASREAAWAGSIRAARDLSFLAIALVLLAMGEQMCARILYQPPFGARESVLFAGVVVGGAHGVTNALLLLLLSPLLIIACCLLPRGRWLGGKALGAALLLACGAIMCAFAWVYSSGVGASIWGGGVV